MPRAMAVYSGTRGLNDSTSHLAPSLNYGTVS